MNKSHMLYIQSDYISIARHDGLGAGGPRFGAGGGRARWANGRHELSTQPRDFLYRYRRAILEPNSVHRTLFGSSNQGRYHHSAVSSGLLFNSVASSHVEPRMLYQNSSTGVLSTDANFCLITKHPSPTMNEGFKKILARSITTPCE